MKLPFEARFSDDIITYQEFLKQSNDPGVSNAGFMGKVGKLYSGNRSFGEVIYQNDGSMKIHSIHQTKVSKEDLVASLVDIEYKLRVVVEHGIMEVSEFSKLGKDSQIQLKRSPFEKFDLYLSDQFLAKCEVVTDFRGNKAKVGIKVDKMVYLSNEENSIDEICEREDTFENPMIGYEVLFASETFKLKEILSLKENSILVFDKLDILKCSITFDNGFVLSGNLDGEGDCFKLKVLDNLPMDQNSETTHDDLPVEKEEPEEDPFRNVKSLRLQKEEYYISTELENSEQVIAEFIAHAKEFPEEVSHLMTFALEMPASVQQLLGQFFTSSKYIAILALILGDEISAQLLKSLPTQGIESIARELNQIDLVSAKEKNIALNFYHDLRSGKFLVGRIARVKRLLAKSLGEEAATEMSEKLSPTKTPKPFEFLENLDLSILANFLKKEHTQTIAMILTHLGDPKKSAIILSLFTESMQEDVASRILSMNSVAPDLVREVERVLERKLYTYSREEGTLVGGRISLTEILNHMADEKNKIRLEQITKS